MKRSFRIVVACSVLLSAAACSEKDDSGTQSRDTRNSAAGDAVASGDSDFNSIAELPALGLPVESAVPNTGNSDFIDLALLSTGVPIVATARARTGASGSEVALYRLEGDTWQDEGAIGPGENPVMAVDSADTLHVIYHDTTNDLLTYATWNATDGWSATIEVDNTTTVSSFGDFTHFEIVVDASDIAHIAYLDRTTKSLRLASWGGTAFTNHVVDAPTAGTDQRGEFVSIAADTDGSLHMAYLAVVNGDKQLRHATGTTSFTTTDITGTARGGHAIIRLDGAGNIHIFSTNVSGAAKGIFWSKFDGSAWTETELLADLTSIVDLDVVIDAMDRPHVLSSQSVMFNYGDWHYWRWNGTAMEKFQITGRSNPVFFPRAVALALDSALQPHIAATGRGYVTFDAPVP